MFGKLVKYEVKSIGKWYLAINAALLVVSFGIGLFIRSAQNVVNKTSSTTYEVGGSTSTLAAILVGLIFLSFGFLIAASIISTIVIIVRRFYTNIFGREGYLTLTLPVSTHQIILSKWLVAVLLQIFNVIIIILSVFLMTMPTSGFGQVLGYLPQLGKYIGHWTSFVIIISILLSVISSVIFYYLAMAIGQLFHNHRVMMSFVAYIGLTVILMILNGMLGSGSAFDILADDTLVFNTHYFLLDSVSSIVEILVAYFFTHYIIKNKLNIQ